MTNWKIRLVAAVRHEWRSGEALPVHARTPVVGREKRTEPPRGVNARNDEASNAQLDTFCAPHVRRREPNFQPLWHVAYLDGSSENRAGPERPRCKRLAALRRANCDEQRTPALLLAGLQLGRNHPNLDTL